jgi:hypothetical protein
MRAFAGFSISQNIRTTMKLIHIALLSTTSCLLAPVVSLAGYIVPATADIFSAGRALPIAPTGDPGTLPVLVPFSPSQGSSFQFQVTGIVSSYYNMFSIAPDGLPGSSTTINAFAGISGFQSDLAFPFVGVFLTDATPQDPAPATLDFSPTSLGRNFLSLSPGIGQVFFIGDGHTDGGATQTFNIPSGATQLYLGLPDAPFWVGDPGHYGDNTGAFTADVTLVPEPSSAMLFLAGAMFLTARYGRPRR